MPEVGEFSVRMEMLVDVGNARARCFAGWVGCGFLGRGLLRRCAPRNDRWGHDSGFAMTVDPRADAICGRGVSG